MSSIRVPFPHRVKQHPKQSPAIASGFFVGGACVRSQGGLRESLDIPGRRWGGHRKTPAARASQLLPYGGSARG